MKLKQLHIAIFCCLFYGFAQGQYLIKDGTDLLSLQKVPQEKIFLHHSSAVLFTGEYLYYKLYCQNAQTNRLSNISAVGYVSLVNDKGVPIFEHKIRLENGMGTGDYFLNTEVPSGNYKLLAYTQWMKNSGLEQLYQDDILIINPYMADQTAILKKDGDKDLLVNEEQIAKEVDLKGDESLLQLQLEGNTFSQREKIAVTLRNYKGNLGHGEYSLLVRKVNAIKDIQYLDAVNYGQRYLNADKVLQQGVGDSIVLPEQRGELFFGQVTSKMDNRPAADKNVIISLPGKEHLLKRALTDPTGHFYTYIRKAYKNPLSIVQVLDEGDFKVVVKKQRSLDYAKLQFASHIIDKALAEAIKERSVHNQIENAYFGMKPDSILPKDAIDVFDGGIPEVFRLDDYTRFATLQETFVEILNTVGYRDGGRYIRVAQEFEKFDEPYNDFPAIVLIDGVFIPDHSTIRDFDARQINTIRVLRDQLVLGATQYQGIVAIETENNDFYESYEYINMVKEVLPLPRPEKNYYKQVFSLDSTQSHIPDYRILLFWEPYVKVLDNAQPFEFYTSDVAGEYEVLLEGFTTYGKPISLRKTFVVK
ncbi:MAG: hypothetical protein KJO73_03325 [Croceitalea sp.]|nr:hypothetical protein [Croceitalea sp.]